MLAEAARSRSSDPALFNSLGEAYRIAGEADKAEAHLRYALHLDRTLSAAHFNLGLLLLDRGDADDAALSFRNALAVQPDFPEALRCLAFVSLEEGRIDDAVAGLRKAAALEPGDARTQRALGEALWASGDTRGALAAYTVASEREPAGADSHFRRACASFELCRTDEALAHFEPWLAAQGDRAARPVQASVGRLQRIDTDLAESDLVRVARRQWHKVDAAAAILSMEGGGTLPEPFEPFSNDMFIARLAPAQVLPGELIPLRTDGSLFLEHVLSQPLQRAHTSRYIMHASDDGRLLMALPAALRAASGPAILLGAGRTHLEWLIECHARLWVVRQREPLADLPLVVQSNLSAWQAQLLAMLGYGPDRLIEVEENRVLACPELHVPSLPGVGFFTAPAAIEHLRRELRAALGPQPAQGRRLYLSRARSGSRRLANEEALMPILERHGFERVHPGDLDIAALLQQVRSADVVLGVEGAAMAHLFFAPPRSRIGMIVAHGLQSGRYFGPSAVLGQDFSFLLAQAKFETHEDHAECDLILDPVVLEQFLSRL
jgi:capsular polysaccharide biosynthesis protein/Flp pilus assembly protein TadD